MNNSKRTKDEKIKMLSVAAVFTALAYIVVLVFHIKVQFLTFEFKDAIMTIGAMICGPVYAVAMSVITALIEFVSIGTTGVYGLIMNIVASIFFTVPASLIYKYKRNIVGASVGLLTSVFTMTAMMLVANLIVTPFYTGMDVASVAGMIPTLLLPFNLTKALLNAGVVLLLYKPLSNMLKKAKLVTMTQTDKIRENSYGASFRTSIAVTAISLILITVSVVVFVMVLGGKGKFGF